VTIPADEVIVAAGAIGSSWLLKRSDLGGGAVGKGVHFNLSSPMTAEFMDDVDAFAGAQAAHGYVSGGHVPDFWLETWFSPPATQALVMPGWFDRHFESMLRYRRMASAIALVGTTTPGRVIATRHGPIIEYSPSPSDLGRLTKGLAVAGRNWLAAGATRVMPSTITYQEYRSPDSLDRLPGNVRGPGHLLLTSPHPQGGNAVGAVVDEYFRVRGVENVWVCDASVFPTGVHVNPQLIVMGVAQYAAERIVGTSVAGAAA
jgi:choline dehydrogenase-like flavoprotein